jgi:DNA-directed RNA polymerase I subunit RPA2
MKTNNKLKETCPSFPRGHLPSEEHVERLRSLSLPHVDSFNYFLEVGLPRGIKDIEPVELDLIDIQKLRKEGSGIVDWNEVSTVKFWMEDVKIAKAVKSAAGRSNKLLPRECRERKIVYAGQIFGKFCYRIVQRRNGVEIEGPPVKIAKTFGNMPIMVLSKACHLEGLSPQELVKLREEVSLFLVASLRFDRGV